MTSQENTTEGGGRKEKLLFFLCQKKGEEVISEEKREKEKNRVSSMSPFLEDKRLPHSSIIAPDVASVTVAEEVPKFFCLTAHFPARIALYDPRGEAMCFLLQKLNASSVKSTLFTL